MSTISPNMNLTIPTTGNTGGPEYADEVNQSLSTVDQHDHSSGKGVLVTPSGLNISSDLPFGSNNATLLRSVRLISQLSPINGASDLGCIYESGVDLYYNDGNGNQIRITQSGSVTGSAGTITGLPSGTASAAYSAGTFVFQSATNTAANIDGGSFIFRNSTASSFGLTLSPPNAMGANYALTLPALPAQTNVMNLDTSGNMGSMTYDAVGQGMTSIGANAIANTRTRATGSTVAVGGVAISASSGTFSTGSQDVAVTNLSVTITTSGRPVKLMLIPDPSAGINTCEVSANSASSNVAAGQLQFMRGASGKGRMGFSVSRSTNAVIGTSVPPGSFNMVDIVAAGTYTYTVQASIVTLSADSVGVSYCCLVAYEL